MAASVCLSALLFNSDLISFLGQRSSCSTGHSCWLLVIIPDVTEGCKGPSFMGSVSTCPFPGDRRRTVFVMDDICNRSKNQDIVHRRRANPWRRRLHLSKIGFEGLGPEKPLIFRGEEYVNIIYTSGQKNVKTRNKQPAWVITHTRLLAIFAQCTWSLALLKE